jgi:adenylate cyclase
MLKVAAGGNVNYRECSMNKGDANDVLHDIQRAVAAETGVRINRQSAVRLQQALSPLTRTAVPQQKDGKSREVTVLITDLRGFTAIAETYSARKVVDALNRYLGRMCEIAVSNGGMIDKFMGDSVMVLFGAHRRNVDDARHAVTCAVQMQIAMDEINRDNALCGLPPLFMGIGINTGEVMAGNLGSALYTEYTVIGKEVNLASRIESFTLRGQVLISEKTFESCRGYAAARTPMLVRVKGSSKSVRVREVKGIPLLGLEIPIRNMRNSPRVEVRIPFTYQIVIDKIVLPQRYDGTIRDIGYQGILAEVKHGLKKHTDILLEFDLSLIGSQAREIYAKVRRIRHLRGHSLAGIEFTSVSRRVERDFRYFVQLLIQGSQKK